ncbi:MAG: 2-oxoacid:acceptor oxidoreductase subunit alpha [Chlamydiae bacterium]|nr:2-oxoacid:acceptor oxidoreductase subunit alpha [Chlamydiota bacterium]MBI3265428.1 2-oxoacid:acceptor oxidoreductase subunit alpha [Chlamydiota bacterium]
MLEHEITVGIGGAAGDGIASTGDTLSKSFSRAGIDIYVYNSYQSVIRGGHVWLRLRASQEKVSNHGDHLDVVIALNQDTVDQHALEVEPGGGIIFNSDRIKIDEAHLKAGVKAFPIPVLELLKSFPDKNPIYQNIIDLGALLALTGMDFQVTADLIKETFEKKGEKVIETNINMLKMGYDYAKKNFQPLRKALKGDSKKRMVTTGNELIAIGATAAGCKFYSAYPMTPATSILQWMANRGTQYGVVVKQAEDEISVVNMAIGAGHVGVRSMCGTSGGGFALMTEAVGAAAMTETPVVIVNVMRGGPSTGLPTKTEQGDLNQVLGASQGDFPRAIIAPTHIVDCYNVAVEAHNLAEIYQCPVLILSDLLVSEHHETVYLDDIKFDVPIDRGQVVSKWDESKGRFKRYQFTESGVSPRALPGTEGTLFVAATDEHDEDGVLVSDVFTNPVIRKQMMEKRMRKLDEIVKRFPLPKIWGAQDAETTLIGWGASGGVIQEAISLLAKEGIKVNHLQFKYLYPFPGEAVLKILEKLKTTYIVEANYTGQFARYLRGETGFKPTGQILKYDGEPFEPLHIVKEVKEKKAYARSR